MTEIKPPEANPMTKYQKKVREALGFYAHETNCSYAILALPALTALEQEIAGLVEAARIPYMSPPNGIDDTMFALVRLDHLLTLSAALRPFTGDEK